MSKPKLLPEQIVTDIDGSEPVEDPAGLLAWAEEAKTFADAAMAEFDTWRADRLEADPDADVSPLAYAEHVAEYVRSLS